MTRSRRRYLNKIKGNKIKRCSCDVCCNPRHSKLGKKKDRLTLQERKANIEMMEGLNR